MNEIDLHFILPDDLNGMRLDQACAKLNGEYSRETWKKWINQGNLKVEDKVSSPRYTVQGGESITVNALEESNFAWQAEDISLSIVYSDIDIAIINKPAGLVVHPGAGQQSQTLLNGLLNWDANLFYVPRAGIVHRLDKDTSGLLVIARNVKTYNYLVGEIASHNVTRIYQALVWGNILTGGKVEANIARNARDRRKMIVTNAGGRWAVTDYRVLARYQRMTLLQLQLHTGRTHQIRVHMASIKHPVVGDKTYGSRIYTPAIITRHMLHATKLSLAHPSTGLMLEWDAELPVDFQTGISYAAQMT